MNCSEFRIAIAESIEQRLPLPADAVAHLARCHDPCCQAEWDEAAVLERAIGTWRRTQSKIDVTDEVLTAWLDGRREPATPRAETVQAKRGSVRPSRLPAARVMVATSAAAVALMGLILSAPGPTRMAAHREVRNPKHDRAGEAGLAYVTYAQNAAQIVTDAVVLTLGGAEQMEDPKVAPIGIGWEAEWPPLGEVHAALDELMESLPADAPPG